MSVLVALSCLFWEIGSYSPCDVGVNIAARWEKILLSFLNLAEVFGLGGKKLVRGWVVQRE